MSDRKPLAITLLDDLQQAGYVALGAYVIDKHPGGSWLDVAAACFVVFVGASLSIHAWHRLAARWLKP